MPFPISASSPSSRRPEAIACTAFRHGLSCRATASRSRRYSITGSRAFGLRLSAGLTFEATRVGIVSQNFVGCSNTPITPVRSGRRVSACTAPGAFTQIEAGSFGPNPHTRTAKLLPGPWQSHIELKSLAQEHDAMIRPHTTGHFTEPAKPQVASAELTVQETADVIGRSLLALVIVVEGQPPVGPAVKAYQAAIRRNGEEAAEAGGREAMEAALRFVMDAAPDRAERRESIIDKAWAGLPGWRS
jgi:hypothetical protein